MYEAIAELILQTESNSYRFENFCLAVVGKHEGVKYLPTSQVGTWAAMGAPQAAAWDAREYPVRHFECRIRRKAEADCPAPDRLGSTRSDCLLLVSKAVRATM